jgi:hypothetical protein
MAGRRGKPCEEGGRPRRQTKFKGLSDELHASAKRAKWVAVQHKQGVCELCGGEQAKSINVAYKNGEVKCVNGAGCRARQRRAERKAGN